MSLRINFRIFWNTLREVFVSSLPLAVIIVIVCGFIAPMEALSDYIKLAVGYICVVLGQAVFLQSLNVSILPIGKLIGSSLIQLKKPVFILFFGFLFGLLATVAEPALTVLARQTNMVLPIVNVTVFIWLLGAGVGVMVGFALFRMMKGLSIRAAFALLYAAVFATVFFVPEEFIALAFDGGGATTGDVSVSFILALGMGVSVTLAKTKSNDETFGIIGFASVGPILMIFIYGIILKLTNGGTLPHAGIYDPGAAEDVAEILLSNVRSVAIALLPVILAFLPFQFFLIRLPRRDFVRMLLMSGAVYIGLLLFLSGIDYGFAFAGKYIGETFLDASRPAWFKWLLPPVGFILGAAIALSEPAVAVLAEQLEEITNGHIPKRTIRLTLAIGGGAAALLSMIKVLTQIHILWFLIPLYLIAVCMMRYTPKLFVGLAFDSGGVTGGALISAFLTPLTLGTAQMVAASAGAGKGQSVLTNGFGMIAFISVTPLIAVQLLGILYNCRMKSERRSAHMIEEELLALESLAALSVSPVATDAGETAEMLPEKENENVK